MPFSQHQTREWSPSSWRSRPAAQQPIYRDDAAVEAVVAQIARLPPLVTSWEIDALRTQLAGAARGERFLLQAGDCAESFDRCDSASIANKLKILLQMSLILVHGGRKRLWCCDPMHGNTRVTAGGIKTRNFEDILRELDQAFDIHAEYGVCLGGVHIELTGEDVTECTGGARSLEEADLARAYESALDPRLNYEQSIEMAMFIAREIRAFGTP